MADATNLTAAQAFRERELPWAQKLQRLLHKHPGVSPLVVLILAVVVFGLINERFWEPSNLSLILQQVAIIGALAVGQTLIILTAGIDLSVGASMIFVTMVMGTLSGKLGFSGWLTLLIGLTVGALTGLLNGALVAYVRLPPFIVTLGTMGIFTALALLMSGGRSIRADDMAPLLSWTSSSFAVGPFHFTAGVVIVILLYVIGSYLLRQTAWGKHVYAVGDNPDGSRLAGVRTQQLLLSVYVLAGVIFAISAWVLIGRVGAATTNSAVDANLDSITAVVIGGTSLFGGRGRLLGTLMGAVIVGVFRNGLALARVDVLYQTLAIGILIIAAVSLDQWIRKTGANR